MVSIALTDQLQLLLSGHTFDGCFPFEGGALGEVGFVVDQFNRTTATGVFGGCALVVLLSAAGEIFRDAGVETAVPAADDVDKPGAVN